MVNPATGHRNYTGGWVCNLRKTNQNIPYFLLQGEKYFWKQQWYKGERWKQRHIPGILIWISKSTCAWRLPDPQTYQLGDPSCLMVWFGFLSFATERVQAGFLFNTNHKNFQSAGKKVRMPDITWVSSHNDTRVIANTARQGKQIKRIREFWKKKKIHSNHTYTHNICT